MTTLLATSTDGLHRLIETEDGLGYIEDTQSGARTEEKSVVSLLSAAIDWSDDDGDVDKAAVSPDWHAMQETGVSQTPIEKAGPPRPGLVPQSGDPEHPVRWVRPEEYDDEPEEERPKPRAPYAEAVVMFHGTTTAAVASIKEKGLVPAGGAGADAWAHKEGMAQWLGITTTKRPQSSFVSERAEDALTYARYATEVSGGQAILLQIDIPAQHFDTHAKADELARGRGAYRFEKGIPPEWITVLPTDYLTKADDSTRRLYAVVMANNNTIEKAAPPRPGLVPQSGDWEHPDRWVRPEDAAPGDDIDNPETWEPYQPTARVTDLYHVTAADNLASIKQHGLISAADPSGIATSTLSEPVPTQRVFFTTSLEQAKVLFDQGQEHGDMAIVHLQLNQKELAATDPRVDPGVEEAVAVNPNKKLVANGLMRVYASNPKKVPRAWQERLVLTKAVVTTPMGKDGVEYDKVKTGDSIWITITNPESPLHGRHILITKRPDGLFAITGGMGGDTEARRHMVIGGTPKRSKRDEALEEEIENVKEYNEPLEAAARQLRQESKKELTEASDQMLEALGLDRVDKDEMLKRKDDVQNYVADQLGEEASSDEAKRITDTIMRSVASSERKVRERVQRERQVAVLKVGKRLAALRESGAGDSEVAAVAGDGLESLIPDRDPFSVSLPPVDALKDLSKEELASAVANHFDAAANQYFEAERAEHPDQGDTPTFDLGASVKPLELKDHAQLTEAIDSVRGYWQKRAEAEETSKALKKVPLAAAVPSTLASIRDLAAQSVGTMSDAEVEQRATANYEGWLRTNTALAFYDAVGEYWNDDRSLSDRLHDKDRADTVMQYHVNSGAATALAALSQKYAGSKLDTLRLIESGNVELAASMAALEARQSAGSPEAFNTIIQQVKDFNATNQAQTEKVALDRHATLDKQLQEIKRQQQSGELLDRIRGSALELSNLVEQRKNLGTALGSLQASATFFDRLEHFGKAKDDVVDINVGANLQDAEAMINRLGLTKNYVVDTSDPDNLRVRVGLSGLGRHVSREKDAAAKNDRFNAIKTNMEGVGEDEQGNMVVDNYDVPGWNRTFTDAEGTEREYKWRVEQRNDIEWLRAATEKTEDNPTGKGGGLITRVVGAGKTNTTLGFYAHQLAANPDYKGIVAVPKGRAEQWVDEAKKFSGLNVQLIPEGASKADVDEALMSAKPGTIVVTGHREAARAHDTINALQTNEDQSLRYHGLTIDEPQELQSRGQSGNVGALGRRLMKIDFDHRLGLTATPARKLPTEAYDLIKWSSGAKDLGSKASFKRSFGGFGSGTNAQDAAVAEAYFKTISPYISGDRMTDPTFKTSHEMVDVKRSPSQVAEQKRIEAQSVSYVDQRRSALLSEAAQNPNHALNRGPEATRARRAKDQARKEVAAMHESNLAGGDWRNNSKLAAASQRIRPGDDKKHVVYIDSKSQRQAVMSMLVDSGYPAAEVKNIAATTTSMTGREMAARVRAFRENPKVNVIMIDRTSASGYNLQSGDDLHVLGTPVDAANYLQAQGRIARMPRTGDVNIRTYRYDDAPEEAAAWNDLDSQLKVLRASSPGLFSNL
jgi:hypothetical protein